MWRALFLAIGVFLMILGVECLGVEKVMIKTRNPKVAQASLFDGDQPPPSVQEVIPPVWAPWSLMSTGAIVCVYSFTIPLRLKG